MKAKKEKGERVTTFVLSKKNIAVLDMLKENSFTNKQVIDLAVSSLFKRCGLYGKKATINKFLKELFSGN